MTFLAGVVGEITLEESERCVRMLARCGGQPLASGACEGAIFYTSSAAEPPVRSAAPPFLVAAEVAYLEKRQLCSSLGVSRDSSEAGLLGAAFAKWGDDIGAHVSGDWCFASWNEQERTLDLVRSPMATATIYAACVGRKVFASSLAQAVVASGAIDADPDWPFLTAAISFGSLPRYGTAFRGVRRVEPGSRLRWRDGVWSETGIWRPSLHPVTRSTDLARRLRQKTEAAVAARLPPSGPIISQLSAGRDSSIVTALAARLAPARVTAITAIPRQGGAGAPTATHFFDEGPSAAATAAHLGIAHRQVDGGIPSEQLSALRAMQRWHHQPILSGYGPGWWQQIGSVAAEMDAHVILTGQLGNYTLSLGGVTALADLRQESGWHAYLSLVRPLARLYPLRTILNQSLSPGVRARIADLRQPPSLDQQLWKRPLHSGRPFTEPAHTAFRERALELLATDLVDRTVFALHGVELAHPVASRELAEFCLRLPLTDLVGGDGGRPLFEAAFGDLLPEGMLREQRRGMQGADWWIGLSPQALRDEVELLARHPLVRDTINLNRVDDYLRAWPMDFAAAQRVEHQYRFMLRTVSAAMFIAENF